MPLTIKIPNRTLNLWLGPHFDPFNPKMQINEKIFYSRKEKQRYRTIQTINSELMNKYFVSGKKNKNKEKCRL